MSSNEVVIAARGLGKSYTIAHNTTRPTNLREAILGRVRDPLGRRRSAEETFWALREVDFEIRRGEVVGIIGRNGAGKSTLLKLLSRITEPTTGEIEICGRMASLLEVGTGFHPELTGRENIFLNGSVLGMRRREIAAKFDEIVDFSGIEKFLDTPVKRYSSGMYVRLAFAVAAHLEPEILVLDEVLAVGDTDFQKKCLGKMKEVAGQGRTVLFVSHSMNSVTRLCQRAILLKQGGVVADGPAHDVTRAYLRSDHGSTAVRTWAAPGAPGDEVARLFGVRVRDESGETADVIDIRRPVAIEMTFEVLRDGHVLVPNHHFYNDEGVCAFIAHDYNDPEWRGRPRPAGIYTSTMWIPGNFLAEGMMVVGSALCTHVPFALRFYEKEAVAFQVVDSHDGDSARGDYVGHYPGIVRPVFQWETHLDPAESAIASINGHP